MAPTVGDRATCRKNDSAELRGWGSPTILVNSADIGGQDRGSGVGCRIYPGPEKVPGVAEIIAKIRDARREPR